MKIAHDNGVGIVIRTIGALVGSEDEPEGSFAESLLRLGPEFVTDVFLSLAVFSSVCYRSTCTCAVIPMRSVSLILATDLKDLTVSLAFLISLNGTKPISLLQSAVGWGGQNLPTGI